MKKNVTISQIAKEAGVSVSTVSRVLNNKPDVLPETREKILQIIDVHNFRASAQARGIASRRSNTIGMVIAHDVEYVFMNQYYTQVLQGVIHETQKRGYYVLSLYCQDVLEAMDAFQQQRIDGILMVSATVDHREAVETLVKNEVPVVSIGSFPYCSEVPCVEIDDYRSASAAMEHLFSAGHRRIAYISGLGKVPAAIGRCKAYLDKMEEHGYPVLPGMMQSGNGMVDSAEMVKSIFAQNPDVTAIFAESDFMAIGVMNALQSEGIRVPEDVSVVGFDDVPMAAQLVPKLTTVCQHSRLKGATAAGILIDWLETGKKPSLQHIIPAELVVRASVLKLDARSQQFFRKSAVTLPRAVPNEISERKWRIS